MSLPPSDFAGQQQADPIAEQSAETTAQQPLASPEGVAALQQDGDLSAKPAILLSGPQRALYFFLGLVMLLLGIIGAVLPVMPTTIFIILAAWFFARSSPKLEKRILAHPHFGPLVIKWRDRGAIPRRAKKFACGGMMVGYALFLWSAQPGLYLAAGVAVFMLACAYYVVSRPEE